MIGSGAGGGTLVRHLALGQADPAARARRLAAARAGELVGATTCSSTTATSRADTWYDDARQAVPAAGPLLRRRRDEAVRRGAVPAAPGGLRRAAPPRRRLAGLADLLRRARAVLHAGRAALPGARRPRRGPDRAARAARRTRIPAVSHEPRIQQLSDDLAAAGPPPVPRPLRGHARRARHARQRLRALRDLRRLPVPRAREVRRRGARRAPGARARERHAADQRRGRAPGDERGRHDGHRGRRRPRRACSETFSADLVVVSCGAANSAKLLLASASDAHPNGLANGSDQVGRNYMFHNSQAVLALSKEPNPTVFQKTLGLNDFYFGADDVDYPLGNIQMVGKSVGARCTGARSRCRPGWRRSGRWTNVARHAVDFWLSTEDLPQAGQPRDAARRRQRPARLHAERTRSRRSGCCTSSRGCSATSACIPTT